MSGISAIGSGTVSTGSVWSRARYLMNLSAARSNAASPARADTPVEPVEPVKPLPADVPVKFPVSLPEQRLPTVEDLNNASEQLVRMRIQYPEDEETAALFPGQAPEDAQPLPGAEGAVAGLRGEQAARDNDAADKKNAREEDAEDLTEGVWESKSAGDIMADAKCETCERRKYQDGSDDPGVSFKSPTHLSPQQAQSAVRGHEMEHVVREQASAAREGRKVVSQSVAIHTAICPECGRVYISGGTTRTVTMENSSDREREAAAVEGLADSVKRKIA